MCDSISSSQTVLSSAPMLAREFPKQGTLHSSGNLIWRLEAGQRQWRRRREELWGVSRALRAEMSPGVGATSLPAAPLGRAVQKGTASEQDEVTAS